MYICICNAVTDSQITTALRHGCKDVADISQTLGVGTCCGSCLPVAQELVEQQRGGQRHNTTHIRQETDQFYPA